MRSPSNSRLRILALGALSALALVAGAHASNTPTLGAASVAQECGPPSECGTIRIEKQTIPNGDPQEFRFDARYAPGGFSLSDDEVNDSGYIDPGEYVITESVPEGWDLSLIECVGSDAMVAGRSVIVFIEAGETATCTFTNTKRGAIVVEKQTSPDGAPGTFSFTGDASGLVGDNGQIVLADLEPGTYSATEAAAEGFELTGIACDDADSTGDMQSRTATFSVQAGETVKCVFTNRQNDAPVEVAPRLVDLALVKTASSRTALNGIVNYSLTVTNRGPGVATNVQVADPAPAGIRYLTANTAGGACNLTAALVTCSLGDLAAGQTETIRLTARATAAGTHTNVATVTGGSSETNAANNVDDAATTVRAPNARRAKPACLTLTVSPKMIRADGRPDRIRVKVTAGKKRMHGTKVTMVGAGIRKSGRSNGNGMAYIWINPRKTGLITITARERNRKLCGAKRIGVAGVFRQRPLTG